MRINEVKLDSIRMAAMQVMNLPDWTQPFYNTLNISPQRANTHQIFLLSPFTKFLQVGYQIKHTGDTGDTESLNVCR